VRTRSGKQHVVHVGFHTADADAIDFDSDHVTALIRRESAARLPGKLAARFARIAPMDLPDSADLDDYDRSAGQMRELTAGLAAEFGTPAAIVGLYEHTTLPAARLREHFTVPGTGVRTATLCRDKVQMKQVLRDAGVPVPRFLAVGPDTPRQDLARFAAAVPGPVVLKPRSQSASMGVQILDDGRALLAHADAGAIAAGYEAEEFIDGRICHFDGIVRGGTIRWFSASRYLRSCVDFQYRGAPLASVTLDDPAMVARAYRFTAAVLRALRLTDSAFHLEAFHTPGDELVFLEIGNRFGGAGVPWQQRAVYGVDLPAEAVLACLGRPSRLPGPASILDHHQVGASGWLYLPLPEKARCQVTRVTGLDDLPGSVLHADTPAVGTVLNQGPDVWPSSGRFLLSGVSTASVERDMTRIAARYAIAVRTGE
jgi:hypothetical protein